MHGETLKLIIRLFKNGCCSDKEVT